ncbi:MAG: Gfo/Idh/MocA family oxidoreductase [Cyanobacteria bacterium P01_F01_bin.53]
MVIRVGLVGTGYAAKVRATAFGTDVRSHVSAVAGRDATRTEAFAQEHGLWPMQSWQALVTDPKIDLVVVATVNVLHAEVVETALLAGKHVVVEYPLALDVAQAERLAALAVNKGLLLHVEHIELLDGLHVAMRSHLPQVGDVSYVNYRTLNPKNPVPLKWKYQQALFGFPFCGALSRVHRLTNLFGRVVRADCCTQIMPHDTEPAYFKQVLSSGRLVFGSGIVAELTYGKGKGLWAPHRDVEIQGSLGALAFVGNQGLLTTAAGECEIAVTPRRGLFVKDTEMVLAYLTEGTPLYVSVAESIYALRVGEALRRSSDRGETVYLEKSE